ncbi:MAG: AAA family ATPase [Planctomycetes bacterium]|nr:AAA family ATPase [Planctomycetota bacterium]
MITTFDIKGFKSIRELHLDCKRINLFIGEPNTGKSNILEALGFLSFCAHGGDLHEYVRYERPWHLFFDGNSKQGEWNLGINKQQECTMTAEFIDGRFVFLPPGVKTPSIVIKENGEPIDGNPVFRDTNIKHQPSRIETFDFIKFYRYKPLSDLKSDQPFPLLPPTGRNLAMLLYTSEELSEIAAHLFEAQGYTLVTKPHENVLEELKLKSKRTAIGFPMSLVSDTLQRYLFHIAAIESNKDSAIVFEEPESHAFPDYTLHLGSRIARDENNNQFFIATHNLYLANSIIDKAPAEDVAVFVTYLENFETKVKSLSREEIQELFESDPFLNLHKVLEA